MFNSSPTLTNISSLQVLRLLTHEIKEPHQTRDSTPVIKKSDPIGG